MVAQKNIVAIIPARGGSKGVPKKNVTPLAGYPLIAYSIIACKLCPLIERTIVSTDSEEIAEVSRKFGAEVPFLRPAALATDKSTDIEFVHHAFDWFETKEGYTPEYLIHMRPTTPLRDPDVINKSIRQIMKNPIASGLRSVHEITESPYKLFGIEEGYLTGLFPDDPRKEYYNLPRQAFPPVYQPNGYVDIIKRDTVKNLDSLHGPRMLAFITENVGELDKLSDFQFIEFNLGSLTLAKNPNKIYDYLKGHHGQL